MIFHSLYRFTIHIFRYFFLLDKQCFIFINNSTWRILVRNVWVCKTYSYVQTLSYYRNFSVFRNLCISVYIFTYQFLSKALKHASMLHVTSSESIKFTKSMEFVLDMTLQLRWNWALGADSRVALPACKTQLICLRICLLFPSRYCRMR